MGGGVGRWAHGGRARRGEVAHGEMGGGTRQQCKRCTGPLFTSLKNLTTTRVGGWGGGVGRWPMEGWFPLFGSRKNRTMGGGVGRWPMEGGQGGGMGGGAPESSVGATRCRFLFLGSLNLIWLVTRGGGPWRAGKGRDGVGAPESSAFQATGLIWLVTRVEGGRWGGSPESSVGAKKGAALVTRVGGWGEAWGGGPWRAGKGGDGGGGTREQCGSNKRCTGSFFWAPLKTGQLV